MAIKQFEIFYFLQAHNSFPPLRPPSNKKFVFFTLLAVAEAISLVSSWYLEKRKYEGKRYCGVFKNYVKLNKCCHSHGKAQRSLMRKLSIFREAPQLAFCATLFKMIQILPFCDDEYNFFRVICTEYI